MDLVECDFQRPVLAQVGSHENNKIIVSGCCLGIDSPQNPQQSVEGFRTPGMSLGALLLGRENDTNPGTQSRDWWKVVQTPAKRKTVACSHACKKENWYALQYLVLGPTCE